MRRGQGEICELNNCVADAVDPDPVSCDPLAGDEDCEIACNAAANDFGLPTLKTVDPGDLSGASTEVCFSGAIPPVGATGPDVVAPGPRNAMFDIS